MRVLILLILLVVALAAGVPAPSGVSLGTAVAHPTPGDRDGDEVKDEVDNCPDAPNGAQINTDRTFPGGDGLGDTCDGDDDADGAPDTADNCRINPNQGQEDDDRDGYGNACPPVDTDRDRVIDPDDNCDATVNPDQRDFDGDDVGDACDRDYDADGFDNGNDNCPMVYNPSPDPARPLAQPDGDGDGIGTACDPDEGLPPTGFGAGTGPVGAAPGPSGSAGDPAAPRDSRKPTVTLRGPARHTGVSTGDRFVVPLRCSEACALEASLVVDSVSARTLRLPASRRTLAKGSWALAGQGSTYVLLGWRPSARGVLRRGRTVRARVVVVAKDPAGNATTVSRAVTLRR